MKVVAMGAGVIGVTTAYYLAKAGCEVTVIDRQTGPGLETSFANAGEVSPGYASPWAGPGVPLKGSPLDPRQIWSARRAAAGRSPDVALDVADAAQLQNGARGGIEHSTQVIDVQGVPR